MVLKYKNITTLDFEKAGKSGLSAAHIVDIWTMMVLIAGSWQP